MDGVLHQVDVVTKIVAPLEVPVTGVLCFVDADWPLIGGAFTTRGVPVLWPRKLAKLLQTGEPSTTDVPATHQRLAEALPSA